MSWFVAHLLYIASEFSVTWMHLFRLGSICGVHQIQAVIAILTTSTSDFVCGIVKDASN